MKIWAGNIKRLHYVAMQLVNSPDCKGPFTLKRMRKIITLGSLSERLMYNRNTDSQSKSSWSQCHIWHVMFALGATVSRKISFISGSLYQPLHTVLFWGFFVRVFHTSIIFFKLLIRHEYFHTEDEYYAAKKRPFNVCIKVDFSELSSLQTKWNRHHIRLLQQHQQYLNLNHNTI